jgi:hypothetical protein
MYCTAVAQIVAPDSGAACCARVVRCLVLSVNGGCPVEMNSVWLSFSSSCRCPGMGKSALARDLCSLLTSTHIDVLPWFCFFENASSCSVSRFVRAVGQSARNVFSRFHQEVPLVVSNKLRETAELTFDAARTLLANDVLTPLKRMLTRPCVLLVDSLDESLIAARADQVRSVVPLCYSASALVLTSLATGNQAGLRAQGRSQENYCGPTGRQRHRTAF